MFLKKIHKSEWLYVFLLSITIILISLIPLYTHIAATTKEQTYLLLHNNIFDFPMFISTIRQGQDGQLVQIQRLTSERQLGTWVHPLYLWAGWVSGPFRISPLWVYHGLRFFGALFLLFVFYKFISLFFLSKVARLVVFFLTVYVGGFPRFDLANGNFSLSFRPFLDFFSGSDVLQRITFLPHSLFRDGLFLLVLVYWVRFLHGQDKRNCWISCICGFLLGFFSPLHSLILFVAMVVKTMYLFFYAGMENNKMFTRDIFYTGVYFLISLPSSIYIFWVFNIIPWNEVREWEIPQRAPITLWEYSLSSGPLFFLALPVMGYLAFLFTKVFFAILLACFKKTHVSKKVFPDVKYLFLLLIPALTVPFFFATDIDRKLQILNFRFLGIPLQIFYGVLAGHIILAVSKIIKPFNSKHLSLAILVFLVFLISSPTYLVSLRNSINENAFPQGYNVYPNNALMDGFKWLNQNSRKNEIVLSDSGIGNMLPLLTDNISYVGHPVSTLFFHMKKQDIGLFYNNIFNAQQAKRFLDKHNIKYVIWSYDETGYYKGSAEPYFSIIKPVFKNDHIQIYQVY